MTNGNHAMNGEKVKKWLTESDNLIPDRWNSIGKEVYARKTLLIAAARDLKTLNGDLEVGDPWRLAATDVFVEKAQKKLTVRATGFILGGGVTACIAIVALTYAIKKAYETDIVKYFGELVTKASDIQNINTFTTTLVALKISAIAGLVAWLIHFLISLSRTMFDEGTILFHRRHALRFGRLYVYLKKGDINFKELEDAFGWHKEFTSAFKYMKVRGESFDEKILDSIKEMKETIVSKKESTKSA